MYLKALHGKNQPICKILEYLSRIPIMNIRILRTFGGYLLAALILFSITSLSAQTQAPDVAWFRTYGTYAAALSLHELPDSGFILGGHIVPEGEGYRDIYVVRTDVNGDTIWTKNFGRSGYNESANCLYPTSDGGFILAGERAESAPIIPSFDMYLLKLSQDGTTEWDARFGAAEESEVGVSVAPGADGGYLLAGYYWDSSTGYDILLRKTNNAGGLEWPLHLAWADSDHPTCVAHTADSGFVVTGYTQSLDAGYDYDAFILRLANNGAELWSHAYGWSSPNDESANHICQTSDGGFLMCGYRRNATNPKDIYVVKTDANGTVEWTSQLGGDYHDEGMCCIETVDGGYAVAALWHRDSRWWVTLIKYNSVGDTTWTTFWDDTTHSYTPYALVQTADNGYAIAGQGTGDTTTAFLVKFNPEATYDYHFDYALSLDYPINDMAPIVDTIPIFIMEDSLYGLGIAGLKVILDTLEHPAIEELTVTLAHNGAEVTLIQQGATYGSDFNGTVLNDASMANLCDGQAPYNGIFRPSEQLETFNYMHPNGDWILTIIDSASGNDGVFKGWGISLITDITLDVDDFDTDGLPVDFSLSQCYPNPFNPSTTIEFTLKRRSAVELTVYNVLGEHVATLINEVLEAGSHQARWNGTNQAGVRVASGTYVYRLKTDHYIDARKMVLLK